MASSSVIPLTSGTASGRRRSRSPVGCAKSLSARSGIAAIASPQIGPAVVEPKASRCTAADRLAVERDPVAELVGAGDHGGGGEVRRVADEPHRHVGVVGAGLAGRRLVDGDASGRTRRAPCTPRRMSLTASAVVPGHHRVALLRVVLHHVAVGVQDLGDRQRRRSGCRGRRRWRRPRPSSSGLMSETPRIHDGTSCRRVRELDAHLSRELVRLAQPGLLSPAGRRRCSPTAGCRCTC